MSGSNPLKAVVFRRLFYFVHVVQCGSVRAAARALSLSPQVVSEALKELELDIGESVLVRGRGQMTLTPRGREVYEHAVQMSDHARLALPGGSGSKPDRRSRLSVSLPHSIGLYLLPDFLKQNQDLLAEIDLLVRTDDQEIDPDQAGVDLVLASRHVLDRPRDPGLLEHYEMFLFAAPELAQRIGPITADRVDPVPVVLVGDPNSEAFSMRRVSDGSVHELPIQAVMTVDTIEVARKMTMAGLAAMLLPRDLIYEDPAAARLVRLTEEFTFGWAVIELISHRQQFPPVFERFMDAVIRYAEARKVWRADQRAEEARNAVSR